MENLVLKIKHENWGLIGPGSWNNTVWKIYGDLSMEVSASYNFDNVKSVTKKLKISQKDFDFILKYLKEAKKEIIDIDALDGSAWEFKQYQGKTLVWEREMGYIYGFKPLEIIGHHLYKISNLKREVE